MKMLSILAIAIVLATPALAAKPAGDKPAGDKPAADAGASTSDRTLNCANNDSNSCPAPIDPIMLIPTSPAFALLGVAPDNISRPTTPAQLAAFFASGLDKNGNIQSGLALDVLPFMMAFGDQVTLKEYRDPGLGLFVLQPLLRTQFSFGTAKGASDADKTGKYAVSVRSVLFDLGDAKADSSKDSCFDTVAATPLTGSSDAAIADWKKAVSQGWGQCVSRLASDNWNRSALAVGFGSLWTTDIPAAVVLPSKNTTAFYVSATYGFEGTDPNGFFYKHMQIGGMYRHTQNEINPDASVKGSFYSQDSDAYGGFVRYVGEKLSFALSVTNFDTSPVGKPKTSYLSFALSPNIRLSDKLWLEFSVGGTTKQADGSSGKFLITSFKYNLDGSSDLLGLSGN